MTTGIASQNEEIDALRQSVSSLRSELNKVEAYKERRLARKAAREAEQTAATEQDVEA
jgi:hypothetical protein